MTWRCGAETLQLRTDGTFAHTVEFAAGGRIVDSGAWRVIPKTERLVGARVVLENALEPCSVFGEKLLQPERRDIRLTTIWEWGRMVLSFNPDTQGFTRE